MVIKFYYKEPDVATKAIGHVIQKKYPEIEPYSKEYWDKFDELMKNLAEAFGGVTSGHEQLHITVYTNDPGVIYINGSKYKLVKVT